jgi:ABC-type Fe3+/spermidine/putrescine transport system ATPase subunit
MTIFNNVAYGLRLKKLPKQEISDKVMRTLNLVNLKGLEQRYPGQLSGGQQQRVALARALVLSPDVLLLDEPLSNLDAKIRVQVRAEIRKLQKELGITTIYVTHDQEEALTLSDRIAVINLGKLQQIGTPLDLYEKPDNPFVADFIGINNLIPGEVQGEADGEGRVKVKTGFGVLIALTGGQFKTSTKCIICVRPETASISTASTSEQGLNSISGAVSFASYIGNTVRYDVDIGHGIIFKVDVQNPWDHKPYSMGEKVFVTFPVKTSLGIPAQ